MHVYMKEFSQILPQANKSLFTVPWIHTKGTLQHQIT